MNRFHSKYYQTKKLVNVLKYHFYQTQINLYLSQILKQVVPVPYFSKSINKFLNKQIIQALTLFKFKTFQPVVK